MYLNLLGVYVYAKCFFIGKFCLRHASYSVNSIVLGGALSRGEIAAYIIHIGVFIRDIRSVNCGDIVERDREKQSERGKREKKNYMFLLLSPDPLLMTGAMI